MKRVITIILGLFALSTLGYTFVHPNSNLAHIEPIKFSEIPGDVSIVDCTKWDAEEPAVSYSLPIDSAKLFLFSDGPLIRATIGLSHSDEDDDQALIKVSPSHNDPELLATWKVCNLKGPRADSKGVGILTERLHTWKHEWYFDVSIQIPNSVTNEAFKTELVAFAHYLDLDNIGVYVRRLTPFYFYPSIFYA